MKDYLTSITPDSFSGIIFAFEGIRRTVTLLNGPTGCKFYHSATSDNQVMRQLEFEPLRFPATWYFGQPRVPCTYLDSKDYVYGSMGKLEEALVFLRDNVSFDLLCIVNSPGAALIGDNLEGIARSVLGDALCLTIETPGFSEDICSGYETAALSLIRKFTRMKNGAAPEGNTEQKYIVIPQRNIAQKLDYTFDNSMTSCETNVSKTVNILGLSIYHRNFKGDSAELVRLLSLCGITVNCILCADCTMEQIKSLSSADLNIVLHPEYAMKTALLLKEMFDTPYYACDGLPVGFKAAEKFTQDVCKLLDCDPSSVLLESEKARARAYPFISRVHSLSGLPKGVPFAVEGTYSELYAYTKFLIEYFGMVPDCASVLNSEHDEAMAQYLDLLREYGFEHIIERDILDTAAEIVFASGITISKLKLRKHEFTGIEISLPTMGYIDVIPKTNIGINGALQLVEQVLNGLLF